MSRSGIVPIDWRSRGEPLPPAAAVALGSRVPALAARLLVEDDAALARLRGVGGKDALVVLGDARALPWVDGVVYLGRDPLAPSLLVPTMLEPDVPIALVERALARRVPKGSPLAILPDVPLVIPCGAALPVARARLALLGRAG